MFPLKNLLKQSKTEDACYQTRFISLWKTVERHTLAFSMLHILINGKGYICTSWRTVKDILHNIKFLYNLGQPRESKCFSFKLNWAKFWAMTACRFLKQVLFTDRQPIHKAQSKQHHPQLKGERDANTDLASEHQWPCCTCQRHFQSGLFAYMCLWW